MDNRIYIPLSTLMRRVANVDYLSGIKVRLAAAQDMDKAATNIKSLLRERHKIGSRDAG